MLDGLKGEDSIAELSVETMWIFRDPRKMTVRWIAGSTESPSPPASTADPKLTAVLFENLEFILSVPAGTSSDYCCSTSNAP